LVKEGDGNCLTDDIFYHSAASYEWGEVTRQVIVDGQDAMSEHIIKLPLEGNILTTTFLTPVGILDFVNAGRSEPYNCDLYRRGDAQKNITGQSITYNAKDHGASCDFVVPYPMNTKGEYLLRFQGKNISGRAPKFYVSNKASGRNDFETILPKGTFDKSYSLLPWYGYPANDYMVNLETRSLGGEVSESVFSNINYYPLPLTWFAGWNIRNAFNGFGVEQLVSG
jgi:hypothetical protein